MSDTIKISEEARKAATRIHQRLYPIEHDGSPFHESWVREQAKDIQLAVNAVTAEKDKKIAELEKETLELAEQLAFQRTLEGRVIVQQQRLSEARFLIERIGTVAVGRSDVIMAAGKWLEKSI